VETVSRVDGGLRTGGDGGGKKCGHGEVDLLLGGWWCVVLATVEAGKYLFLLLLTFIKYLSRSLHNALRIFPQQTIFIGIFLSS
jgi:hypothetical protein